MGGEMKPRIKSSYMIDMLALYAVPHILAIVLIFRRSADMVAELRDGKR